MRSFSTVKVVLFIGVTTDQFTELVFVSCMVLLTASVVYTNTHYVKG